jgi:predicted TPR repeat methyltransferase
MTPRSFMSSGDLAADRRFDYARDLLASGDLVAAADLLRQAIERAPDFASAWFALGDISEQLNQHGDAIAAFREAVRTDSSDRHGASLRLMRIGAIPLAAMSQDYVATLFDQYADRFEQSLVGLSYRGPAILFEAVNAVRNPMRFAQAIDLGCGTGLGARAFAGCVDGFIGVDLAPQMVTKARTTELYTSVIVADMIAGLRAQQDASFDLVLAADAAVYLADIAPLADQAARVLQSNGLLAFTVETHPGDGVVLGHGLRYAHSGDHVRDALAKSGLTLLRLDDLSVRNEDGVAVPGLVVVAIKL